MQNKGEKLSGHRQEEIDFGNSEEFLLIMIFIISGLKVEQYWVVKLFGIAGEMLQIICLWQTSNTVNDKDSCFVKISFDKCQAKTD